MPIVKKKTTQQNKQLLVYIFAKKNALIQNLKASNRKQIFVLP